MYRNVWLGWPHPTGSDWWICCLGDPSSESLSMATLLASINELEKKLSHVVKATVESTLSRLGTVGAMAIEEFVERLKAVVVNAANAEEASGPSTSGSTGVIQASAVTPVLAPPAGSVTVREGGSIASSTMPSAFGDVRSVMTSVVPQTVAVKPGKNLIRSHDGF